MTNAKRTNIFNLAFDNFAGRSESANADLSRLVISATRPLRPMVIGNAKIIFANDVTNVALAKVWEQLLRQQTKGEAALFRLSIQDVTTHGAQISTLILSKCVITDVELSPLDLLTPDTQQIEICYTYSQTDVSLIGFSAG